MADFRNLITLISICLISNTFTKPTSIGRHYIAGLPGGTEIQISAGSNGANVTITNADRDSVGVSQDGSETVTVTGVATDTQRVELTSNEDVSVYLKYGASRSLLIPSSTLGSEYYLPKLATGAVLAVAKDTELKIGGNTLLVPANLSYKLDNSENSKLTSNGPISVFMLSNATGLILQPSNVWGSKFLILRTTGDEINVMAQGEDVKCKDGKTNYLDVKAGESIYKTFSNSIHLHCTSAVQVIQFNKDSADKISLVTPTVQFATTHTVDVAAGESIEVMLKKAPIYTDNLVIEPDTDAATTKEYDGLAVVSYDQPTAGRYTIFNKNPSAQMSVRVLSDSSGPRPTFLRLTNTANCEKGKIISEIGDGMDNDCDGWVDEELHNYKDDDGDGEIDEDIALPNEHFPADIGGWKLSYTVLIVIILVFLLLIFIGICHWQCNSCDPKIETPDDNLMLASYDSRMLNYRYSMSGSVSGFTLSRR